MNEESAAYLRKAEKAREKPEPRHWKQPYALSAGVDARLQKGP